VKICIISSENLPTPPTGYWGGIESVVYDLASALDGLRHEVTLIARPESKSPGGGNLITTFPDVPDELGLEERHFNIYRDFVSKFDGVVHDHSNGKRARMIHPKVLNTMHWCQHPSAAGFKNISAVSHTHAMWLEQYMPEGRKIPVVHHGIAAERFIYSEEKEDYYLFFSVLSGYKGAFDALMLAKETEVNIVFAGKLGEACDVLKSINMANVTFLGEVSNEQRNKLMSKAKALIFPTGGFLVKSNWMEVFGLVQLEALVSGTPVISSDNGACPEIIENGKNGFVCRNYEEMKGVIEENLVEDISPKTCRRIVEERFSSEIMARNYLTLYEKLNEGW